MLHLSQNETIFRAATRLFFEKWRKVKNANLRTFLAYFETEWILSNLGWYEGVEIYTPSSNNALESVNNVIKTNDTYREQLPLDAVLPVITDLVHHWSRKRDPTMVNNKIFQESTTISAELWKSSVAYAKQDKPMISISCANCEDLEECSNTVHYFMPAGDEDTLTHDQVESYRATFRDGSWTSFSEFLSQAFGIWQVEMSTSADEWKNATCSCPVFYISANT